MQIIALSGRAARAPSPARFHLLRTHETLPVFAIPANALWRHSSRKTEYAHKWEVSHKVLIPFFQGRCAIIGEDLFACPNQPSWNSEMLPTPRLLFGGTGIPTALREKRTASLFPARNGFSWYSTWFFSLLILSGRERLALSRFCILQLFEKKRWMGLGTRFFYISFWHVAGLRLFVSNLL